MSHFYHLALELWKSASLLGAEMGKFWCYLCCDPFFSNKILTAADDTMLKIYDVSLDQKPMENGDPTDLEGETFAICSDQVGQIAVGGVEKQVSLY